MKAIRFAKPNLKDPFNKCILVWIIFAVIVWFATSCVSVKKVEWIGHPVISDNDPYFATQGWLPDYLIGLREDGVVVWKEKP